MTVGRRTDDAESDGPDEDTDHGSSAEGEDVNPVVVAQSHPVLLFDGVCNVCNWWVRFVIQRDPEAEFRFAPLQSAVATELLEHAGYEGESLDSVVLVEGGEYYDKSDAVIRGARHLGGLYTLLLPSKLVPTWLRNRCYDAVAKRRYRWFGRREQCMVPGPDIEQRFLAGGPAEE